VLHLADGRIESARRNEHRLEAAELHW
jgi:hypothetical protein